MAVLPDVPRTHPFQIGDIVRLNSGSPDMTVVDFQDDEMNHTTLAFVSVDGSVQEITLPAYCLKTAKLARK